MISITFNQVKLKKSAIILGATGLTGGSVLEQLLNNSEYDEVPAQIRRWNKAGGKVLDGLIRRREAEAKMFMNEYWYEV